MRARRHARLEDNLNPVGSIFYGASTMICTPASLAQEVGLALGAQAGEKRLRDVIGQGGFSSMPPPRLRSTWCLKHDRNETFVSLLMRVAHGARAPQVHHEQQFRQKAR